MISSVSQPITQAKSSVVFGAWMMDPKQFDENSSTIWVFLQFIKNSKVEEYANIKDLERWRPRAIYILPYEWSGNKNVKCLLFSRLIEIL